MQFVSGILSFQFLLVLIAFLVAAINALRCSTCLDRYSCSNPQEPEECTVELVKLHHNYLVNHNPTLDGQSGNVFQCYDLELSQPTEVVQKGCTYNTTNICEGWNNNVTIVRCSTCDAPDDCNKGQTEGTTTPVSNSTTTAGPANATTTSASVTASTTTEASTTTVGPANATTTSPSVNSTTTSAGPANSTTTSASVTTTTVPAVTSTTPKLSTTSASSPVTTPRPTTTTVETTTAGATTLGCVINWCSIAGYASLHALVVRWL